MLVALEVYTDRFLGQVCTSGRFLTCQAERGELHSRSESACRGSHVHLEEVLWEVVLVAWAAGEALWFIPDKM